MRKKSDVKVVLWWDELDERWQDRTRAIWRRGDDEKSRLSPDCSLPLPSRKNPPPSSWKSSQTSS
jgi:hypothetical protein